MTTDFVLLAIMGTVLRTRRATPEDHPRVQEICANVYFGLDFVSLKFLQFLASDEVEVAVTEELHYPDGDGSGDSVPRILGLCLLTLQGGRFERRSDGEYTVIPSQQSRKVDESSETLDVVGWCSGIRVAEEARGRGIARYIFNERMKRAKKYRLSRLRSGVNEKTLAAMRLPEGAGFEKIMKRRMLRVLNEEDVLRWICNMQSVISEHGIVIKDIPFTLTSEFGIRNKHQYLYSSILASSFLCVPLSRIVGLGSSHPLLQRIASLLPSAMILSTEWYVYDFKFLPESIIAKTFAIFEVDGSVSATSNSSEQEILSIFEKIDPGCVKSVSFGKRGDNSKATSRVWSVSTAVSTVQQQVGHALAHMHHFVLNDNVDLLDVAKSAHTSSSQSSSSSSSAGGKETSLTSPFFHYHDFEIWSDPQLSDFLPEQYFTCNEGYYAYTILVLFEKDLSC